MDLDLECQLNWVDPNSVTTELLETLKSTNNIWFAENMDIEGNDADEGWQWHSSKFPRLLSLVVVDFFQDGSEAAEKRLNEITEKLEAEAGNMVEGEVGVLRYLVLANKAVLKFRRMGNCADVEQARQEAVDMLDLTVTVPNQKAMVLAIKAGLLGFLGDREIRVTLFNEVVALVPDVPKYWVGLFEAVRRLRREDSYLGDPNDEEISAIRRAYELAPESRTVLTDMATHYHDIFKMLKYKMEKRNDLPSRFDFVHEMGYKAFVSKMQEYARLAYESNRGSLGAAVRYAEVLWCERGRSTPKQIRKAKAQFHICLQDWPKNSTVLHNVGKFNCCTSGLSASYGLKLLARSLESDGSNFPALMDYLRHSYSRTRLSDEGLIEIIEAYLPYHVQRKPLTSQLHCLKATLLANGREFDRALDSWMVGIKVVAGNFWDGNYMGMCPMPLPWTDHARTQAMRMLPNSLALEERYLNKSSHSFSSNFCSLHLFLDMPISSFTVTGQLMFQSHLFGRNVFSKPNKIRPNDFTALRNFVQNTILNEAPDSEDIQNLNNLLEAIDTEINLRKNGSHAGHQGRAGVGGDANFWQEFMSR